MAIFSIIGLVDQSKPCTQIYLQKLQIAQICNLQLEFRKITPFGHLTDIQADVEINRLTRYIKLPRKEIIDAEGQTDGRTDGQTDRQTSRTTTICSFFRKKEKTTKKQQSDTTVPFCDQTLHCKHCIMNPKIYSSRQQTKKKLL